MSKYNNFKRLKSDFYFNSDVLSVARQLLGKVIVKKDEGRVLMARIVETEAYEGVTDPASHAYQHTLTQRTSTMFEKGGTAYVYLCYGMHRLFNIVTNKKSIPHAVLIRAIEPLNDKTLSRSKKKRKPGSGPALVSQYLDIQMMHNGMDITKEDFYIADDGYSIQSISVSPRIGVDYAGEAAKWPYRFFITDHPHVTPHIFNKRNY